MSGRRPGISRQQACGWVLLLALVVLYMVAISARDSCDREARLRHETLRTLRLGGQQGGFGSVIGSWLVAARLKLRP